MKHSEEDRLKALEACKETKPATGTIRLLGLGMSRGGFCRRLKKAGVPVKKAKPFRRWKRSPTPFAVALS